jgi:hypothetical protein
MRARSLTPRLVLPEILDYAAFLRMLAGIATPAACNIDPAIPAVGVRTVMAWRGKPTCETRDFISSPALPPLEPGPAVRAS